MSDKRRRRRREMGRGGRWREVGLNDVLDGESD
jgi:hypothetical protein